MSDHTEQTSNEADVSTGTTSRRSALKMGVATGIGVAAWSGVSITSLGGTPAYAAGCTFIIEIDLSGGCRNTDQAAGAQFGYHTLKNENLPAGYGLVNNVPEGTACNAGWVTTLTFPDGITCSVTIQFAGPPQCTGGDRGSYTYGPESDGAIDIALLCVPTPPAYNPNTQYTIIAKCATTGAPEECLT
jgi:hypothetical protein